MPVIFSILFLSILELKLNSAAWEIQQLNHSSDCLMQLDRVQLMLGLGSLVFAYPDSTEAERLTHVSSLLDMFEREKYKTGQLVNFPELLDLTSQEHAVRLEILETLKTIKRGLLLHHGIEFDHQRMAAALLEAKDISDHIIKVETQIREREPKELERSRTDLAQWLCIGLIVSLAVSIGLAIFFTSDIIKRLKSIAGSAQRVARGKILDPPGDGTDEIAHLERSLYGASKTLAEARSRELAILDNAADVICSLDSKLKFTAAGAATIAVWQYDSADLLGLSLLSILDPSTVETTRSSFQKIAESESGDGEIENIVRCKDGGLKHFVWAVNWSATERVFFCVAHDVTELREIEKMKQSFLAMVSHDLRAPLTSVSLSLDMLLSGKKGALNSDTNHLLETTRSSMGRLLDLVNELLELEKLEAGKLAMNKSDASAADMCREAVQSLHALAAGAGIRVDGPHGDAAVIADDKRIVQVLINLITNAIKFSPRNSTIKLSVEEHDGVVEFRVADQGPGIPADQKSLIFEKFRQSRAHSNVAIKSSGLGLAIVRAIVEAHGGTLGVDSEVGKGSTFWFKLPAVEDELQ